MDATPSSLYKGHRFPVEIISHCVWLYHRFPLSLRDVEEMMAERGVSVGISPHFRPRRHLLHAQEYRREMAIRFTTWNQVVGLSTTA